MRIIACLLLFVVMYEGAFAQAKKTTVAVIEFGATEGINKTEIRTLTNRFRDMLVQTNAFNVIERDKMESILKEQDFILSDNCNSAECAVQVGQMLGVEQMIAGDIGKVGDTWTVGLRLIDMTTAKIIKTKTGDYQGKIDGLLEIMSQIAYIFAGKAPPQSSTIKFAGEVERGPLVPRRFRIEVAGGVSSMYGSWHDGGEGPAYDFSIGYFVSPRMKVAADLKRVGFNVELNNSYPNEGDQTGGYQSHYFAAGTSVSLYATKKTSKPYLILGGGFSSFTNNLALNPEVSGPTLAEIKEQEDLEDRTSVYWTAGGGADFQLSQRLILGVVVRYYWAKPTPAVIYQIGLGYQMGGMFEK